LGGKFKLYLLNNHCYWQFKTYYSRIFGCQKIFKMKERDTVTLLLIYKNLTPAFPAVENYRRPAAGKMSQIIGSGRRGAAGSDL
jgi:hypothetical protein